MSAALGQPLAWSAAFWAALLLALREPGGRAHAGRVALGLALGALLAHLGWGALHVAALREAPSTWLDPTRGYCILFVPIGVILAAPRRGAARRAFLEAGLGALPLAFALARLGCLLAGCCGGLPTELSWAIGGRHPTPLYEATACAGLHGVLSRLRRGRAAVALGGIGLARFAVEPWRASPPLGPPAVPPEWLALLWVGIAAWLGHRERAGERSIG